MFLKIPINLSCGEFNASPAPHPRRRPWEVYGGHKLPRGRAAAWRWPEKDGSTQLLYCSACAGNSISARVFFVNLLSALPRIVPLFAVCRPQHQRSKLIGYVETTSLQLWGKPQYFAQETRGHENDVKGRTSAFFATFCPFRFSIPFIALHHLDFPMYLQLHTLTLLQTILYFQTISSLCLYSKTDPRVPVPAMNIGWHFMRRRLHWSRIAEAQCSRAFDDERERRIYEQSSVVLSYRNL